jgi:dolichol-phosphate mannosyltransferase
MRLSVVIPVCDEAENIEHLLAEIDDALAGNGEFEIIVVDDGSTDSTPQLLSSLQWKYRQLRVLRHATCCGQSAALQTGVDAARSPVVATLDGDGQNNPLDLPAMVELLEQTRPAGRVQMVAGFRAIRRDSWWRILCSRVANRVRSGILRDDCPDSGCGIKVFRRAAFLRLPRFHHMHRFLPALIIRDGGEVVTHPVSHRPRQHGRSHYDTLQRLLAGLIDLTGVAWLVYRSRAPGVHEEYCGYDDRTVLDDSGADGTDALHRSIHRAVA